MIDQSTRPNRELLAEVVGVLKEIGLPDIVLVGAMARDIWLDELGHPSERATNDVDFGFGVRDWAAYAAMRSMLLDKHGFTSTNTEHRLKYRGHDIDLVPFGAIGGSRVRSRSRGSRASGPRFSRNPGRPERGDRWDGPDPGE